MRLDLLCWIRSFQPNIERCLGRMPPFTLKKMPASEFAQRPDENARPWVVDTDPWAMESLLYYNPASILHHYLEPTPESEPRPNAIGRLTTDLIHDLCHLYQADAIYFWARSQDMRMAERGTPENIFFSSRYHVALCGMAEFAAFAIGARIYASARMGDAKTIASLPLQDRMRYVLENRLFKKELGDTLLWQVRYAYRAAVRKGWYRGSPESFPPINFLPYDLKPLARRELRAYRHSSAAGKSPQPRKLVYDLGIYAGAALRKKISLKDIINHPVSDAVLLQKAGIKMK